MRITKFVHSCLLVETDNLSVLIDPGRYSWDSHLINPNHLPDLSHIIITHEHGDHYHEPALRALSQRFPHASIVTNNDLAKKIEELKLPNPISAGTEEGLTVFEAPHEPLPLNVPAPLNIGVHIGDSLTHPGDSLAIKKTGDTLVLPVTGPSWVNWGQSLKAAVKLKPKQIIPVHDWHWHQMAREEQYDKIKIWLKPYKIKVLELKNAEPVEL